MILNASFLFHLSFKECELLANKAGLSLSEHENGLLNICKNYPGKHQDILRRAAVSERMFQYYLADKKIPTKQALLAIALSLELSFDEVCQLLHNYGYHLSTSLPNDAVVLWFLVNRDDRQSRPYLLSSINEALAELALPLLMTQLINR